MVETFLQLIKNKTKRMKNVLTNTGSSVSDWNGPTQQAGCLFQLTSVFVSDSIHSANNFTGRIGRHWWGFILFAGTLWTEHAMRCSILIFHTVSPGSTFNKFTRYCKWEKNGMNSRTTSTNSPVDLNISYGTL